MNRKVINFIDRYEEKLKNDYYACRINPNNMSYWFPKLFSSSTRRDTVLKLPETKIIFLDFETWKWIRLSNFTREKINEFTEMVNRQLDDFMAGEKLFMKTGVFSNKMKFDQNIVTDRGNIGIQFLEQYYYSIVVGNDLSAEIVFREFIENVENRLEIFQSLPLRTEFRVFYDFNEKRVIGIMNYWHPEIMEREGVLSKLEFQLYQMEKDNIVNEYNEHKDFVVKEIDTFMQGCKNIMGRWAIDVMLNGEEFWIIDMSSMEDIEVIDLMEKID